MALETIKAAVALLLACAAMTGLAVCPVPLQSVPSGAARNLAVNQLRQHLACKADDPLSNQSPCNVFAGKALEGLYGLREFRSAAGYMSANDIADHVASTPPWRSLGKLLDPDNTLCAQAAANAGHAVIAVMKGAKHGHVAIVIPGEPIDSPSWKMAVPNSASFLLGKPGTSYVGGPLSRAFSPKDAAKAMFYYRPPAAPIDAPKSGRTS